MPLSGIPFLEIISLALVFMWTDFKFNRQEGVILIGCYAAFLFLLYGSI